MDPLLEGRPQGNTTNLPYPGSHRGVSTGCHPKATSRGAGRARCPRRSPGPARERPAPTSRRPCRLADRGPRIAGHGSNKISRPQPGLRLTKLVPWIEVSEKFAPWPQGAMVCLSLGTPFRVERGLGTIHFEGMKQTHGMPNPPKSFIPFHSPRPGL